MLAPRYDACLVLGKANLPIPPIAVADTSLSLLWDTTRLRLLVEIERQGTVSAAARTVGIGQPTASEHLRLLEASAGQRLVESSKGAQMLVVGSRGGGGFLGLKLGSTASQVVGNAHCPVVVVPVESDETPVVPDAGLANG